MYEKQRDNLGAQQFNIDQQAFMVESMKDTVDTVATMKQSAKSMKKEFKKINLDKVEDLQDDIQDLMYEHEEVQEVMSRALGMDELGDLDEEDLDAELAALDDLDLDEEEPEYLSSSKLPSAPTSDVKTSAGKETDEYGLPAVPIAEP